MLKMPEEFGTADEALSDMPRLMAEVEEADEIARALRSANPGGEEVVAASGRVVVSVLAAEVAWLLAAVAELQTEVKMLRGDGR